jgi:hypothetical protein
MFFTVGRPSQFHSFCESQGLAQIGAEPEGAATGSLDLASDSPAGASDKGDPAGEPCPSVHRFLSFTGCLCPKVHDEGSTPSTRFGGNHLAERAATLAQVAVLLWRMGW